MNAFLWSGVLAVSTLIGAAGASLSAAVLFNEDFDGLTPYIAEPTVDPQTPGPYSLELDGKEITRDSWLDFRNRVRSGLVGRRQVNEGYAVADTAQRETVLAGVANHADAQLWAAFVMELFPDLALVKTVTLRLRVDKNRDGVFNDPVLGSDVSVVLYGLRDDNGVRRFFHQLLTEPTITRDTDGFFIVRYRDIDMSRLGRAEGVLRAARIDPAQGPSAVGVAFEIDYLRVEDGDPLR